LIFRLIIAICLAVAACAAFTPANPPASVNPEHAIARTLVAQIDSFIGLAGRFDTAVQQHASPQQLQQLFLQTRLAYKKFEWAAEYFNPAVARLVNGEPVPEAEPVIDADPSQNYGRGRVRIVQPEGLQVIEGILYPQYDTTRTNELLERLGRLQVNAARYKLYFNNIDMLSGQVFDAARLEVFRIMILGISGFDAQLSLNCLNEAATALGGVQAAMGHYSSGDPDTGAPVSSSGSGGGSGIRSTGGAFAAIPFEQAIACLRGNSGFNDFNRALFITTYANPIAAGLARLEGQLHIPVIRYNRLLRQDAVTLFAKDAFDADAYAPGPEYGSTDRKIALGKRLFSDPMLSGTGTRSCASCHRPDQAFADGLVRNTVIGSRDLLARNTPTLLNAALQPAQFYDLRVNSLEEQVWDVVHNEKEMQSSVQMAVSRLQKDSAYRRLFAEAFPPGNDPGAASAARESTPRSAIDTLQLMNALAAYVRSLVRLNSRFDDYMRGDTAAMTPREILGFNLFMGKARCGTCHYMPLFNGVFPPQYDRMETEVIGVPGITKGGTAGGTGTIPGKAIDEDPGRFAIVNAPFLRHAFKTTTVRNAARTAPYMHNGVFGTLEEVMDFYNNGGAAGSGWPVDNQTLAKDSLHLTTGEKNAIIAFIGSLDSR
jgi:cytochrome c peroxidase